MKEDNGHSHNESRPATAHKTNWANPDTATGEHILVAFGSQPSPSSGWCNSIILSPEAPLDRLGLLQANRYDISGLSND